MRAIWLRTRGTEKIDRSRVDLSTRKQVLYWSSRLDASEMALSQAVREVGTDPETVGRWLVNHALPGTMAGQQARGANQTRRSHS